MYLIDLFSKYVSLKEKKPMFDPKFLKTYQRYVYFAPGPYSFKFTTISGNCMYHGNIAS